jgi:hypothetical protein
MKNLYRGGQDFNWEPPKYVPDITAMLICSECLVLCLWGGGDIPRKCF